MAKLNASYNVACFVSAYIPYGVMAVLKLRMVYESFVPLAVLCIMTAACLAVPGFFFNRR